MSKVKWVMWGLLAWMALSVPVAIMLGKAIKAHQEPLDLLDPEAVWERKEYLEERDRLERLDHLEQWAKSDRWGQPASKANPVNPVRLARWVRPDQPPPV